MSNNEQVLEALEAKLRVVRTELGRLNQLVADVETVQSLDTELSVAAKAARVKAVQDADSDSVIRGWSGDAA
jgi:hypothetical protein